MVMRASWEDLKSCEPHTVVRKRLESVRLAPSICAQ
jgi:hypothetical protein